MRRAYGEMHRLGHAHSIEVFDDARLVGGCTASRSAACSSPKACSAAESGGSKVALAALAHCRALGWPLFDAQIENAHLLAHGRGGRGRAPDSCRKWRALTALPARPARGPAPSAG